MEYGRLCRAMRLSIGEGALACAMGTLTGGVFLTGFALALGASRFQIGLLAAMPTLANFAQLLGALIIERTGQQKGICLGALSLSRILWLVVLLTPLVAFAGADSWLVWTLIALQGLTSALNAIGGVGWLCWIRDLVPETLRIGFLSRRNQIDTVLALSLSIAGGAFIDWWATGHPGSLIGFAAVFAVAMACGLVSLALMSRIPEAVREQSEVETPPHLGRLFLAPLRERNFRRVLGFYGFWNLACNLATPFFTVYMLERLGMPFWYVTVLATLSSVCGLVANPFWTRLSQKFGHRPVIFVATLGDALYPLWWLLVSPQWSWVLIPIHCSGVFSAPLAVGPNNLVLKLSPTRNASPYVAVFNSMVGPVSALAAVMGGYLAGAFSDVEWSVGQFTIGGLQVLFLISALGRIASLLLLWRVVEPHAQSIRRVVRTLQRLSVMRPTSWLPHRSWSSTGVGNRRPASALAPIAGRIPTAPEPGLAEAAPATLSAA
ncbi:MAG TPA: MFS transporter [Pirellulales bacterium]|nr:MFS transporter [Pirellulales bacterium]